MVCCAFSRLYLLTNAQEASVFLCWLGVLDSLTHAAPMIRTALYS